MEKNPEEPEQLKEQLNQSPKDPSVAQPAEVNSILLDVYSLNKFDAGIMDEPEVLQNELHLGNQNENFLRFALLNILPQGENLGCDLLNQFVTSNLHGEEDLHQRIRQNEGRENSVHFGHLFMPQQAENFGNHYILEYDIASITKAFTGDDAMSVDQDGQRRPLTHVLTESDEEI